MNLNLLNADSLAQKLQGENLEQFNTLVRMHLSFVLDLNTDDSEILLDKGKLKKWNFVPFGKRNKSSKGVMDGIPLTQEGICQVYQLIEFLKKEQNICVEGIFRRTGSLMRQQELKNLLNQGVSVCLENNMYSVHDCASVLKAFLAELPEPLLTDACYPAYYQIAELCGVYEKLAEESRLLHALQLLLLLLPSENKILLKDVLDLLNFTAAHECSNKMSADSLATLFTPHLLCPRTLSPQGLHQNSQMLSGIISFMIKKSKDLFHIPPKLAVDIRAYYSERERRKLLSPKRNLNESVSDNFAANTVYTFVDIERTTKENESNPTETALAELYAYIQGLPESSKKRKLVKQFNKENGHGTPLQLIQNNIPKSKGVGSSIKKHIFKKGIARSLKKNGIHLKIDGALNSPQLPKKKLFCTKCDSSTDVSNEENLPKTFRKSDLSPENVQVKIAELEPNMCVTSTPAYVSKCVCTDVTFMLGDQERKSMSPITRSAQGMSKAMQETMMTPRSRKPVLLLSGTNINNLPKLKFQDFNMDSVEEEEMERTDVTNRKHCPEHTQSSISKSPADSSFSSCTDDYCSKNSQSLDCLNSCTPSHSSSTSNSTDNEKELVLRPKQYDDNGKPIIFETSF